MTYTISQFAKKFDLSRSTLLYYDKIGLLTPAQRSDASYRIYSDADCRRMEEISRLRSAGIPVKIIQKLLNGAGSRRADILRQRLEEINREISRLRRQQHFIVCLLDDKTLLGKTRLITKDQWITCLRQAGLDDAGMNRWHAEFEKASPEAHQDFLESLGLPPDQIHLIRKSSLNFFRSAQTNH